MSILSDEYFHNEEAAYKWVEAHVWPEGPICPKCGEHHRVGKMGGKSTRIGTYKCYVCRKPFTVKVGTIFEDSHVPMQKWLQAFYLLASNKKGISANQLHRTLKVTLRTAWFMAHRIREAMRSGDLSPMGGNGGSGVVEVDETFFGRKTGAKTQRGYSHKNAVLSLVERGGEVRSFHIDNATAKVITPIVNSNVAKIMTDDAGYYRDQFGDFAGHGTVRHSLGEYGRGQVHSNTVESYFSVFKRGMKGTYQHCDERHLHRYLAEFDFRYNACVALGVNDEARAVKRLMGVKGTRLTHRSSNKKVSDAKTESAKDC